MKAGDANRCLDCPAEKDCPYSAKKSLFYPLVLRFKLETNLCQSISSQCRADIRTGL